MAEKEIYRGFADNNNTLHITMDQQPGQEVPSINLYISNFEKPRDRLEKIQMVLSHACIGFSLAASKTLPDSCKYSPSPIEGESMASSVIRLDVPTAKTREAQLTKVRLLLEFVKANVDDFSRVHFDVVKVMAAIEKAYQEQGHVTAIDPKQFEGRSDVLLTR